MAVKSFSDTFPHVTEQADQAAVIHVAGGHLAWLQGRRELGFFRIRLHFPEFCRIQIRIGTIYIVGETV